MTINGSTNSPQWTFKLEAYELSWDINTNTSRVRVDVYIGRASSRSYCGGDFWGSVNVDGQVQNFSGIIPYPTYVDGGAWYYTGVTKDFTIGHNNDGTKSVGVNASWGANFTPSSASAGGILGLTTIPRASSITATSAYVEEVSQLTITKKNNNFIHSISFNFGGLTGYINVDGSVSDSEVRYSNTSVGFTIPKNWYTKIPNAQSGVGTIYINTYNGNTKIGDTQWCSITARASSEKCTPILECSVVDIEEKTLNLSNNEKTLIKGYSKAKLTWSAEALNSASLTSVKVNDVVVSESPYIFDFKTDTIKVVATDSRGFSRTVIPNFNFINYFNPNITLNVLRKEPTSSQVDISFNGTWFNDSFGEGESSSVINVGDVLTKDNFKIDIPNNFYENFPSGYLEIFRTNNYKVYCGHEGGMMPKYFITIERKDVEDYDYDYNNFIYYAMYDERSDSWVIDKNFNQISYDLGTVDTISSSEYISFFKKSGSGSSPVNNELSIFWQYKEINAEEWIEPKNYLQQNVDYSIEENNVYSGIYDSETKITIGGAMTYDKAWAIKVVLHDKLAGDVEIVGTITKGIPVIWWNENALTVEGDLYIKKENIKDYIRGYVLFEGSAQGNVSLSDDYTNYQFIDIYFTKSTGYNFTRWKKGFSPRVDLISSWITDDNSINQIITCQYQFSGRQLVYQKNMWVNANINAGNVTVGRDAGSFVIHKIVGYK